MSDKTKGALIVRLVTIADELEELEERCSSLKANFSSVERFILDDGDILRHLRKGGIIYADRIVDFDEDLSVLRVSAFSNASHLDYPVTADQFEVLTGERQENIG